MLSFINPAGEASAFGEAAPGEAVLGVGVSPLGDRDSQPRIPAPPAARQEPRNAARLGRG